MNTNFGNIPIPDQTDIRAQVGARMHPILFTSEENQEEAVNIFDFGIAGENYYFREDNPPYMHRAPGAIFELYVRRGILERLLRVNHGLKNLGLGLYVFDAYRPVEVQTYFHDVWVPNWLRELHPDWSENKVVNEVTKYWATSFASKHEIDPNSPPPHATGAVLDLTLQSLETGALLDMGGAFDQVDPVSFADHYEQKGEEGALSIAEVFARANRRLLYCVMTREGFIVHPNEWWHFGLGDQMSAFHSGLPYAVYSTLWLPHEIN